MMPLPPPSRRARLAALIVTAIAFAGLAIQFMATSAEPATHGSAGMAAWIMLRYFTIWTNLIVALLFAALAIGHRRAQSPLLLGGATLSILLVGIIYGLLLRGLLHLSGGALLADTLLHRVVPILVPLWWLIFAPKGQLDWLAPWLWALFPSIYLPYALLRGMAEGRYAYPFIDPIKLGWSGVAFSAAMIALGFIAAGHGLVWMDRRLGRRP